jgi:hypothetical protein
MPQFPSNLSASGIWTLKKQKRAKQGANWPPLLPIDLQFNYVTMLLHGNGTNGRQNNTFLDSSTNNFTITRNGNTTQGTFSPYGSNWSNYFDGSGDFLSGIGTTSSFNFMHNSSALFTSECWVYFPSTASEQYLFANNGGGSGQIGCALSVVAGGALSLFITRGVSGVGNVTAYVVSTGTVPTNQWVHIAVTYDQSLSSSNAKFYINGASAGTGNKTVNTPSGSNATNALTVAAANSSGSSPVSGYISNLRIVNSIVYTAAFTPSTSSLTAITNTSLLACQSNRFIDNSTNAFTLTRNGNVNVQRFSPFAPTEPYTPSVDGGSGYFDGSGDWLSAPNNAAFAWGTGSLTVECWFYLTATAQYQVFLSTRTNAGVVGSFLGIDTGTSQPVWYNNNALVLLSPVAAPLNVWTHVAFVRNGTTSTIYLNGVSVASGTDTNNYAAGNGTVGYDLQDNNWAFNGYISNLRAVKGSAVYTGNFTPPSAPLTAITNTSLLLNFTNAGIIDNAEMNNLETVGNAQISTAQSKFGGGSMLFDGTGDYLVPNGAGTNLGFVFGTGDFTIEFWVYFISGLGSDIVLYDSRPLSTNGVYPTLYVNSSSQLSYVVSGADRITSGSAFSATQWYHIALCRSGTSTRMFINGVQVGSTYSDSNNYLNPARRPVIAINGFNETAAPLNGYIDDLRITKAARYTTSFTPQRSQWQDQ